MEENFNNLNSSTILFGNGDLPTHPLTKNIIKNAKTIICVDGGANKLVNFDRKPDYIIGDLDSLSNEHDFTDCKTIKLPNQSKNDLEKALDWCLENQYNKVTLIGFSGLRDDHNLASLLLLKTYAKKISLTIITNYSTIHCKNGKNYFDSKIGQVISIIALNRHTKISTEGLKYKIEKNRFSSPGNGISNVATSTKIMIESNDWVWIFLNHI